MTEEAITLHIVMNTNINSDRFRVIACPNNRDRNYVSFQIVTLNEDIYTMLMDESLWPGYTVRDYRPMANKTEFKPRMNQNRNGRWNTNQNGRWNANQNKNNLRENVLRNNFQTNRNAQPKNQRFEGRPTYMNSPRVETPRRTVHPKRRNIGMTFQTNNQQQAPPKKQAGPSGNQNVPPTYFWPPPMTGQQMPNFQMYGQPIFQHVGPQQQQQQPGNQRMAWMR